jgi:flavin-dependent dehydrogenase
MAKTMKFFGAKAISPEIQMTQPALCISRHAMDRIMSDQFKSMGGELCTGLRVASEKLLDEGTVLASGRKPNTEKGATWTGYKFHVQGLKLEADLEMHFIELGYVGMCQVEKGRVNVCGLMPSKLAAGLDLRSDWKDFLRSNLHPKKHEALESAERIEGSTCCVSGISYDASQLSKSEPLLKVGDRMSTIPPLTGNGMSLAIESAWLASEPIARYADSQQNWSQTLENLADLQTSSFQKRLAVSVPLQHVMMAPFMHGVREHVIKRLSFFHKTLFNLTR